MERRSWVPDVPTIADDLVEDYRSAAATAADAPSDYLAKDALAHGDLDAIGTMASWFTTARQQSEQFTEDDWIALVQVLAKRLVHGPERSRQDDLNTAALSDLLGVPPFVQEIDRDVEDDEEWPSESAD